jgi:transposase-like protein
MPESTLTVNRWTPTRKAAVILELLRGGEAAEPARTHGLSQAQLCVWRDRFLEGGQVALKTRRGQLALEQDRQVRELERTVGQLTLEKELRTNPTR